MTEPSDSTAGLKGNLHAADGQAVPDSVIQEAMLDVKWRAQHLLEQKIGDAIVVARHLNTVEGGIFVDLSPYSMEVGVAGAAAIRIVEELGWTVIRNPNGPRTLMLHTEDSLERQRTQNLWAEF